MKTAHATRTAAGDHSNKINSNFTNQNVTATKHKQNNYWLLIVSECLNLCVTSYNQM